MQQILGCKHSNRQQIMISVNADMFPVRVLVLLCSLYLSHSAPRTCEDLLRPLDKIDPHHLEGPRALVAGSLSHVPFMELFKRRDSSTSNFIINQNNITFKRSMRLDDKCHYGSYNISLNGTSFTFRDGNVTATFTQTSCRDCLLLSFDVESGKRQHFYLFSRRTQLEQEEMEEFRAQVECLNMPQPVVMDPTKELCPEEAADDPAAKTEEKREKRRKGRRDDVEVNVQCPISAVL